jgi:hypothetical protein
VLDAHETRSSIQECGLCGTACPENVSATAAAPRTSFRCIHLHGGKAGPEHDTRVQQREKLVEVIVARRREQSADHPSLASEIHASGVVGPSCTRRRARLTGGRAAAGERRRMEAISSKRTANMSSKTKATRSAGASLLSTTSSARPTESPKSASSSGSASSSRLTGGSATTSRGSSRPGLRARTVSKHTQVTTSSTRRPRVVREAGAAQWGTLGTSAIPTASSGRSHRPLDDQSSDRGGGDVLLGPQYAESSSRGADFRGPPKESL